MIRLYDTMAREKRAFEPADPSRVTMYVCGPTVYNRAHIGNARPYVVFDLLARLLRHHYGADSLVYARNFTDVDDKIIDAARAENVDPSIVTSRYEKLFLDDMAALSVLPTTLMPRATEHIGEMIGMIARLIETGHAYEAEEHVLFHVPSDRDYGVLSRRDRDAMIAGARVEVASYKKDPADFVLWKPSAPDVIGWDSPWGRGRPGWHIECSAMAEAHLGETIDIHAGGVDLQFPHHENEIAQSEGANGKKFVNYWMHNGFVQVDKEKMSKSLGNFFTVRDILKKYDAEVVRFFILRAHYRSPLNYSDAHLDDAKAALTRLYTALRDHPAAQAKVDWHEPHAQRFKQAMDDDFGTPEAVAELHQLANQAFQGDAGAARQLKALGGVLGLLQREPQEFLQGRPAGVSEAWIAEKIAERQAARARKDYGEADRIRAELLERGIVLEDKAGITSWRRL